MPKFDQLTGLLSGQNLEQRLDGLLDRADDTGEPLSIAIADLGGLRAINDAFGREGGDEVLRTVARAIVEVTGDVSRCYRLGGDAFIVLYPGLVYGPALEAAKALREAIAGATATMSGGTQVALAAFTGVAAYPGDAQRARSLIRVADRRMQEARAEIQAAATKDVQTPESAR
jgi:two-component system cell cycle response regulator